jgi:hypothetical protein
MTEGPGPQWDLKESAIQVPTEEVEMVYIDDQGFRSDPSRVKRNRRSHGRRKTSKEQQIPKERMTPLFQIMGTILSTLTSSSSWDSPQHWPMQAQLRYSHIVCRSCSELSMLEKAVNT